MLQRDDRPKIWRPWILKESPTRCNYVQLASKWRGRFALYGFAACSHVIRMRDQSRSQTKAGPVLHISGFPTNTRRIDTAAG
jgi:hypothetical protein